MAHQLQPRPPRWSIVGLDDAAQAIGYVCIVYSLVEQRVSEILGKLTGLADDNLKCITNQVDMLKELSMIRGLGFIKQPSAPWYEDLELIIWTIERRNRFVHDRWLAGPTGAVRRHDRTKIRRPQSREPQELTTYEYTQHDADDIWQLINEMSDVAGGLGFLRRGLDAHQEGRPVELLPRQLRDQLLAQKTSPPSGGVQGQTSPAQPSQGK